MPRTRRLIFSEVFMGKSYALIASAFVFTVMAPLATVAYHRA